MNKDEIIDSQAKKFTTIANLRDADDKTGDMILDIPEEILDANDWKEGDILEMEVINGAIHISRIEKNDPEKEKQAAPKSTKP